MASVTFLILLFWNVVRRIVKGVYVIWLGRPSGESRLHALSVACNGWLLDHRRWVVGYLFIALGVRTVVKVGSFFAVSLLLWDGVPGTRFDGIPRLSSIPSLVAIGIIAVPIFLVGIYQDIEKAKRFGNRLAHRTAVLDEVDVS